MYRVELKEEVGKVQDKDARKVPNVPCGVESKHYESQLTNQSMFLMYRVELKVLAF